MFIGILSPILTNIALWQQKEWRLDRIRVYFTEKGLWWQLWSKSRIYITLLGFLLVIIVQEKNTSISMPLYVTAGLMAAATFFQIITKRQIKPIWTKKAILITVASVFISSITIRFLQHYVLILLYTMYSPVFVMLAWVLILPIDTYLKYKILQTATTLCKTIPNCTIIAITGSVGKTTTKEVLGAIMKADDVWVTPEHINTELGISNWFIHLMKSKTVKPRVLILEMGAYRIGEIALMCRIFPPTIGIITLIGTQHIALFGSKQNIWQGKSEIIAALQPNGTALLNGDDAYTASTASRTKAKVETVGTNIHCTYRIKNLQNPSAGLIFTIGATEYFIPIHGEHNSTNIGLAIAAAKIMNVSDSEIAQKIQKVHMHRNTFTIIKKSAATIVNDTYNSSPESAMAAIEWAKKQSHHKKILVFAGFIEQGTNKALIHANIGDLASKIFTAVYSFDPKTVAELKKYIQDKSYNCELYTNQLQNIAINTLIVVVGRVPQSFITKLQNLS